MGNLVAGVPAELLKNLPDQKELEEMHNTSLVGPGFCDENPELLLDSAFESIKPMFPHSLEIDMAKSGFDSLNKRNELMTNRYLQAGFTTP